MTRFAGFLVVLALLLAASPASARTERIVGGTPAAAGEFPWMAGLQLVYGSGNAGCGGALIAQRYIVTAAHCLSDENGNLPTYTPTSGSHAILGSTDLAQGTKHYFADVERHPDWFGSGVPDVGVITLAKPATQDQLTMLRPVDGALWRGGVQATIAGWGLTDDYRPPSPNQLLKAEVPIYSDTDCGAEYTAAGAPPGFVNFATEVCAGGDGKDSCNGDSGGPLMVPHGAAGFALAGLVSWGPVIDKGGVPYSCAEGLPGVYTRTAADPVNAWIRERVPQVDLVPSTFEPEPDQPVTLTVATSNPNGPYDAIAWDLDGDGVFAEQAGKTSVTVVAGPGQTTWSVRATRGLAGSDTQDRETRHLTLEARHRALVAFASPAISVVEGQPATLTVTRSGTGSGTATATPSTGAAAVPLVFDANTATYAFALPTVDDTIDEPDETFRVDLGGFTGDLVPGSPTSATVTVLDNDDPPPPPAAKLRVKRRIKTRTGRFRATVTTDAGGTLKALARDARGRTLGRARKRTVATGGRHVVSVALTAKARRTLKRRRKLVVTLVVTYAPGAELPSTVLKRRVTLRYASGSKS